MKKQIKIVLMLWVVMLVFPLYVMGFDKAEKRKGRIITVQELSAMQAKGAESSRLVLIEVAWGGPKDYNKGHIPGAIHVNTDEIEYDLFHSRSKTEPKKLGRSTTVREDSVKGLSVDHTLERNWWNIYPDVYLLPALADMGIAVDSKVVVYAKDPNSAARLVWTLLYAGVEDVNLLSGGLKAWKKASYRVSKTPVARTPVPEFGSEMARNPQFLVDIKFVRNVIQAENKDVIIADIRTKKEYDGKSAPYSYIPTKGRIKGALWGKAGDGPWTMENYVNNDGTLKKVSEVEQMWMQNGITKDKHVLFYCGTSWRSSLAFYFAYAAGWDRISNFDSSWYEWSLGPEAAQNPVE